MQSKPILSQDKPQGYRNTYTMKGEKDPIIKKKLSQWVSFRPTPGSKIEQVKMLKRSDVPNVIYIR